jgi:HlyD family secretion protein
MTANVNIVLGEKDDVLRVNNSALRFNPPGFEPAQGGGFGNAAAGRVDELAKELDLNAEQRKAVEAAMADMQTAIAEMRDGAQASGGPGFGGFGGGNPRERFGQLRQRMTNQLTGVLTPEQMSRFEQSFGGGPGGGPGGGGRAAFGGAGGPNPEVAAMRPGQVWVLENGQPKAVRVLVGLSDGQNTEVLSQDLEAGDEVIVRLAR